MLVYQVLRTCGVQLLPLPHKAELQSNLYWSRSQFRQYQISLGSRLLSMYIQTRSRSPAPMLSPLRRKSLGTISIWTEMSTSRLQLRILNTWIDRSTIEKYGYCSEQTNTQSWLSISQWGQCDIFFFNFGSLGVFFFMNWRL
jgi:hypothetical protein